MAISGPVGVVVVTIVYDVGHATEAGGAILPSFEVEAKLLPAMSPANGIVAEAHATVGHGGITEAELPARSQRSPATTAA